MKIINCAQGSEEWLSARSGVITASMFGECRKRLTRAPNKGDFTAKAHDYAYKLAIERISGDRLEEDKFETYEMRRGRAEEPNARLRHEQEKGILIEQVGLALTDDGKFGASVDGIFDPDGISEYKCFISPVSLRPILTNKEIDDHKDQVMGGLWITGKKVAHFCLYCPQLAKIDKDLTVFEIERDDDYIEELEADMWKFDRLVCEYESELRG